MTDQPTERPGLPPAKALGVGVAVILAGILVLTAASIDPWLLVMMAGLGVAGYSFAQSEH